MVRVEVSREISRAVCAADALVMFQGDYMKGSETSCPVSGSGQAQPKKPITSKSESRNSPERYFLHFNVLMGQNTWGSC